MKYIYKKLSELFCREKWKTVWWTAYNPHTRRGRGNSHHMSGDAGDWFGLTREMVGNVVMDYLKDKGRQNPFLNGKPGNDWWLGFMRRWPKLVERKPQHLPANCAMALTEVAINAWISKVKSVIEEAGLKDLTTEELAKRMWNCDETAFATDVASKKILAKRGEKNVHETGGGSGREYIAVLGCG